MGFFFAEVEEGNGNDVVDDDDDEGDDDDRGGGGQCGRSKAEVGRDEGRIIWSAVDDQKSGIYKRNFLQLFQNSYFFCKGEINNKVFQGIGVSIQGIL